MNHFSPRLCSCLKDDKIEESFLKMIRLKKVSACVFWLQWEADDCVWGEGGRRQRRWTVRL